MLPLLQLLLPEVAAHHRVAVLVDAIGEVLKRHADDATLRLERERLLTSAVIPTDEPLVEGQM